MKEDQAASFLPFADKSHLASCVLLFFHYSCRWYPVLQTPSDAGRCLLFLFRFVCTPISSPAHPTTHTQPARSVSGSGPYPPRVLKESVPKLREDGLSPEHSVGWECQGGGFQWSQEEMSF